MGSATSCGSGTQRTLAGSPARLTLASPPSVPSYRQQQHLHVLVVPAVTAGRPVSASGNDRSRSHRSPSGEGGGNRKKKETRTHQAAARSASAHGSRRVLTQPQCLREQHKLQQQPLAHGGPLSPTGSSVSTSVSRAKPPTNRHAYRNEGDDTRRSSQGVVGVSSSGGGGHSSAIAGLNATLAASAIPLPRHTSSAARATPAPGLAALLVSLPGLPAQHAVRELVVDLAELLHRRELLGTRLAADPRRAPDEPPPRVFEEVEAGAAERLVRLSRLVGRAGVDVVLAAVTDPGFKEALGLVAGGTEEDTAAAASAAGCDRLRGLGGGASQCGGGGSTGSGLLTTDEEEAVTRVWRRRLDASKVPAARHAAGGLTQPDATASGGRQLWNVLASVDLDPEAPLSYYQKSQLRYGRARRGSTSIAGAWEEVFGSAASASTGCPMTQAPAAGSSGGAAASLRGAMPTASASGSLTGSIGRSAWRWRGPVAGSSPASAESRLRLRSSTSS